MPYSVNPILNSDIKFLDIVEMFEKYGLSQSDKSNFALMLEVSGLIGYKNKKDSDNSKKLLDNIRREFLEF